MPTSGGIAVPPKALMFDGIVSSISALAANTLSMSNLAGPAFGDGFFDGWYIYVARSATTGLPVLNRYTPVSGYTSIGGVFVTGSVSGTPLAVGDEVYVIHPTIVAMISANRQVDKLINALSRTVAIYAGTNSSVTALDADANFLYVGVEAYPGPAWVLYKIETSSGLIIKTAATAARITAINAQSATEVFAAVDSAPTATVIRYQKSDMTVLGTWTGAAGQVSPTSLTYSIFIGVIHVGLGTTPGQIVAITIATMLTFATFVGAAGQNEFRVALRPGAGPVLVACTNTTPAIVLQLNALTFAILGTWTGASGQNSAKAIDIDATYIYVGLGLSPVQAVIITTATMVTLVSYTGDADMQVATAIRANTIDNSAYLSLSSGQVVELAFLTLAVLRVWEGDQLGRGADFSNSAAAVLAYDGAGRVFVGLNSLAQGLSQVLRVPANGDIADDLALIKRFSDNQVSFYGWATAAGAADGSTIICTQLAAYPSFVGQTIRMVDTPAATQARLITAENLGTNTLTVDEGFKDSAGAPVTIPIGARFIIFATREASLPFSPGVLQVLKGTIDLNQAAGTYDLFTGSGQAVELDSFVIRMSGGTVAGAVTSIAVQTNDATAQVIIDPVLGAVANLTNEAQIGWPTTSRAPMYIKVGKKGQLTIAGGAAGVARVCDWVATYRAVVTGGKLV